MQPSLEAHAEGFGARSLYGIMDTGYNPATSV